MSFSVIWQHIYWYGAEFDILRDYIIFQFYTTRDLLLLIIYAQPLYQHIGAWEQIYCISAKCRVTQKMSIECDMRRHENARPAFSERISWSHVRGRSRRAADAQARYWWRSRDTSKSRSHRAIAGETESRPWCARTPAFRCTERYAASRALVHVCASPATEPIAHALRRVSGVSRNSLAIRFDASRRSRDAFSAFRAELEKATTPGIDSASISQAMLPLTTPLRTFHAFHGLPGEAPLSDTILQKKFSPLYFLHFFLFFRCATFIFSPRDWECRQTLIRARAPYRYHSRERAIRAYHLRLPDIYFTAWFSIIYDYENIYSRLRTRPAFYERKMISLPIYMSHWYTREDERDIVHWLLWAAHFYSYHHYILRR